MHFLKYLAYSRSLLETISENDRDAILAQLSELIPTLDQDPSPVTNLIEHLTRPRSYTFSRVLAIKPQVDFASGLSSSSIPINLITLHLLEKASQNKADAGLVAASIDTMVALIRLWLSTPDTAVAQKALRVLSGLLQVDGIQLQSEPFHQSLVWRRVFRDRDIYGLMFSICSLTTVGEEGQLSKRNKTVAQARLLDLLVNIDCELVRSSQIPEIETRYGVKRGGIMEFAAAHMVDYADDIIMHTTLIDFFAELLRTGSSPTLDFLIDNGLHDRTISYYIEPNKHNSLDLVYIYGRSANYISEYCSNFGAHIIRRHEVLKSILLRLSAVFDKLASNRQVQNQPLTHDLHVLVSLPLISLLPQSFVDSPFLLLHANLGDADILKTLATVFRASTRQNPSHDPLANDSQQMNAFRSQDNQAARVLYFLYLNKYPNFWKQIVQTAETLALKDVALAAIEVINAVIMANWDPLPTESLGSSRDPFTLPTEQELALKCHPVAQTLPSSGILAILSSPAVESVVPYLIRPAQTFNNLVGGTGDSESAAYKVAVAKYDALKVFHEKIQGLSLGHETFRLQDILTQVGARLARGPMGGMTEVGGRIATLDL